MPAISTTPNAEAAGHAGNPLPVKRFHQRLRRVHADQHQDEQEQHHHRAGVDHDLYDAEEQVRLRSCKEHRARTIIVKASDIARVDRVGGHHHTLAHRSVRAWPSTQNVTASPVDVRVMTCGRPAERSLCDVQ